MRNYRIIPSTWLNDNEFIGVGTKTAKYWIDYDTRTIGEKEVSVAVYGWSKTGKSFFVYTISDGHISKLGTMKRAELLDFRSVTV